MSKKIKCLFYLFASALSLIVNFLQAQTVSARSPLHLKEPTFYAQPLTMNYRQLILGKNSIHVPDPFKYKKTKGRSVRLGFTLGAAVGLLAGIAIAPDVTKNNDYLGIRTIGTVALFMVGGALIGAGTGALIGDNLPADRKLNLFAPPDRNRYY